ncbi:metal-dependent transcriptional regulator [Tenacibaculum maritimum]|uniref:metal-dependent transcriptional regulator n=1 Tax=Tenacibaculum maritimum TaxID=107401 RepID=UPI0012E54197|nr:metal-dependent transcriptional regulator [Tenacibaculum maritimum]CAA0157736.1 metal-dependent transcriptional regulator [Tenacibaculum maritimum]
MLSQSEENYLKAIYHLATHQVKGISTNAIAKKMQTKASSVTDMIKKLSEKELVIYKKYQGVNLSEKGKVIAISIVRKHRLWESFLVDKLGFHWDKVHDIAEQLEHIKSEELVDKLDAYLEFPTIDPHGDPIPDKEGNITTRVKVKLATLKIGEKGVCVGVNDSSAQFLQFLDKQGIALGQKIQVLEKESFDDSLLIKINEEEFRISNKIANNLYIQK